MRLFVTFRIPCTLPVTFRQPCYDTLDNYRRVYRFLIGDNDICNLLGRFRSWPLVFVPENNNNGNFLFTHQVYWQDSTSLLSNLNDSTLMNSHRRISIQRYYSNDIHLQKFFLEILQIPFEPTIDDYFPLLTQIVKINDIWRVIEVIIRLTFQQNRQLEIKGNNRALIVFILNIRVKYSDRPFYPNDLDIADCLANTLSIIQLPGK